MRVRRMYKYINVESITLLSLLTEEKWEKYQNDTLPQKPFIFLTTNSAVVRKIIEGYSGKGALGV